MRNCYFVLGAPLVSMAKFYSSDFPYESLDGALASYELKASTLLSSPHSIPTLSTQPAWDTFYSSHGAKFFHPRQYLLACFPLLATLCSGDQVVILECGVGNGSNLATLLPFPALRILACDLSAVSLAALAEVPACAAAVAAGRLTLLQWDMAAGPMPPLPAAAAATSAAAQPPQAALLFFTLSAVPPSQHLAALQHLAAALQQEGGHLMFRDYGAGDHAQLRAPDSAILSSQTHLRGDGTLSHYFSTQELGALLTAAGFTALQLQYHTVQSRNRKTGQCLKRVFVHALARLGSAGEAAPCSSSSSSQLSH
jgi:hypothetical protein